jgi:hypothetical protein
MPAASNKGKDEYAKALDDFEERSDGCDARATPTSSSRLSSDQSRTEHVGNAERLVGNRRNVQQASSPTAPGPAAGARQRP